jgi:hypothetical protein
VIEEHACSIISVMCGAGNSFRMLEDNRRRNGRSVGESYQ